MKNSGSLAKVKLPEPIEALEPYKERLHIINGLHGKHTAPRTVLSLALWEVIAATMVRLRLQRQSITS